MSINRTAHTFGAEAATSTLMNAEVKALWDGLQDSWTAYTPTWSATGSAPSIGNGAIAGRYLQIGKTIKWYISVYFGSTTNYGTGFYRFGMPDDLDWNEFDPVGQGIVVDTSTGDVYGYTAAYALNDKVRLYGNAGEKVGATSPITLATGDRIIITGMGELV